MNESSVVHPAKKNKLTGDVNWINQSFEAPSDSTLPIKRPPLKKPRKGYDRIFQSKRSKTASNDSWMQRFRPQSKDELAVHKKKVCEVEDWLKNSLTLPRTNQPKSSNMLLLTGPSGAGKTATVEVLAKELDVDVSDWSSSLYDSSAKASYFHDQVPRQEILISENQGTLFSNFLLRAGKYPSLFAEETRRIVLIEEFPNAFLRDPSIFHGILRTFGKNARCPTVFIVSNCSSSESLEMKLFPSSLQSELQITNISFNPIAPTMLLKVINKIHAGTRDSNTTNFNKSDLEAIASDCNGDVRNAINLLQFQSAVVSPSVRPVSSTKSRSSKNAAKDDEPSGGRKDSPLFLFHALGKVLYSKRDATKPSDEGQLPPCLHSMGRHPLLSNPEKVFEQTSISADGFSMFLHENYLSFVEDVSVASRCSEAFSCGDVINTEWTARDVMSEYTASCVARGLMFNLKPLSLGNRWRPLRKPQYYGCSKDFRSSCSALKNVFKESRLTLKELQTELVPYLFKIGSRSQNEDQRRAITKFGKMLVQTPTRSQYDSLSEKDVVDDETISSDGNMKATLLSERTDNNFIHEESDEEFVIEDYDDDEKRC